MSASSASGATSALWRPAMTSSPRVFLCHFFLIINNYTNYKTHDTPYLRMYIIVQTEISERIYSFFYPLLFITKTCCDDAIVRGAFKGTEEQ